VSFATTAEKDNGFSQAVVLGRRALPRVGMCFPVRLHLAGLPCPLDARTRDLGVGGACIATSSRFALADLRRVTLMPPTGAIELLAEGRWQTEVSGDDAFLTGLRFLEIPGETRDELWDLAHEQAKSLTRWLSQQPAFAELDLRDTLDLVHVTRLRDVKAGGRLYRQSTQPRAGGLLRRPCSQAYGEDSIFVLARGEVVLETRTPLEQTLVLARARAGEVLGGIALAANMLPGETAIVEQDASLLEISRGAFENLKQASPALAFQIASIATRSHLLRLESVLSRLGEQR
jgi:CRP-like cAMP-binding protein